MANRTRTRRPASPTRESYVQARISVDENECWNWMLSRDKFGYGYATWQGVRYMAHRFAYETYIAAIPDGLVIDHLCRNPSCVNPAHLEPVPQRINLLRGESPMARAVRTGRCAAGHELAGDNLYVSPMGERHCRACLKSTRRRRYLRDKKLLGIPDRRASARCFNPNCDRREYLDGLCTKCHSRRLARRASA